MLFDLQSGKRRRVVQVVYTLLAVSFLLGFVIFGVGSGGIGGVGDLFGGGSGSGSSGASLYQPQIDRLEKTLKKDPKDERALVELARVQYLAGIQEGDQDPATGQITPTDDTLSQWNQGLDAWERYLKLSPDLSDRSTLQVAQQMVAAYQAVGDAEGAAKTQALVVKEQPSALGYGELSYFLYSAGKIPAGDAAAHKAVSEAKGKEASRLRKALAKVAKQAKSVKTAARQQSSTGGGTLQDPFGGFGGSAPTGP